jgi:diaminopimelate decarboxylase
LAYFYENGRLKLGTAEKSIDVDTIAQKQMGPVYIYDLDSIESRISAMKQALKGLHHSLHYAMKANHAQVILKRFCQLDCGVDTVSAGELDRAEKAGFSPAQMIFSGVGKTRREIERALKLRIKQINIESPAELERINELALALGKTADIAFRLNPDVDAKTHPYITTGFRENKFGMDESFLPELAQRLKVLKNVRFRGLTMHIGSALSDVDVICEAITKTLKVHDWFESQGFKLDRLDIGGGLGIAYETEDEASDFTLMAEYGKKVTELINRKHSHLEILTEPGRWLVGRCGILVGEVQYIKNAPAKNFAILDTGMHHLIRPALYSARHRVLPTVKSKGKDETYDVVGPICESSDFLAKSATLPALKQGDRLALADTGAYGAVMQSSYNSHPPPAEVFVRSGEVQT